MAQASMSVEQKIAAALKGEHRTEAELARDADRDPMAALQFIGLRDDMTVINNKGSDPFYAYSASI
jgi:predicted methyltransferase